RGRRTGAPDAPLPFPGGGRAAAVTSPGSVRGPGGGGVVGLSHPKEKPPCIGVGPSGMTCPATLEAGTDDTIEALGQNAYEGRAVNRAQRQRVDGERERGLEARRVQVRAPIADLCGWIGELEETPNQWP